MKVVHELVAHFDRRGRLPPELLERLLVQGLLADEAPRTMLDHCTSPGQCWYLRVTGDTDGPAWGTDVYTGDSVVAVAAVHAGLVAPGETRVLRAVVVEPPPRFEGSERHGVTSHDFERYGSAFRLEPVGGVGTPAGAATGGTDAGNAEGGAGAASTARSAVLSTLP
jgi:hypothetical protein